PSGTAAGLSLFHPASVAKHAADADEHAVAVAVLAETAFQAPAAVVGGATQADADGALALVPGQTGVVRGLARHPRRLLRSQRGGDRRVHVLAQLLVGEPDVVVELLEAAVGVGVGLLDRVIHAGPQLADVDRVVRSDARGDAGDRATTDIDLAGRIARADVGRVVAGLLTHRGLRTLAQRHAVVVAGHRALAEGDAVVAAGHGLVADRQAVVAAGHRAVAAGGGVGAGRLRLGDRAFLADLEHAIGTVRHGIDALVERADRHRQVRHVALDRRHPVTEVGDVTTDVDDVALDIGDVATDVDDVALDRGDAVVQVGDGVVDVLDLGVGVVLRLGDRVVHAALQLADVHRIGRRRAGRDTGDLTATHVDFAGRAAGADIGTVVARLPAHRGRRTGAQRNAVGVGGRRTGTQGQAVQADRLGTAAHRHRAIAGGRCADAQGHRLVTLGL